MLVVRLLDPCPLIQRFIKSESSPYGPRLCRPECPRRRGESDDARDPIVDPPFGRARRPPRAVRDLGPGLPCRSVGAADHRGVTGFVVLSGYCVHRNGLRRERDDVGGYALRRLLRIYPVYAVACFAGL